ncbi:MAG: hypothetical protein R6V62_09270 [Candidatus Fermentibacteraceae bacterium]
MKTAMPVVAVLLTVLAGCGDGADPADNSAEEGGENTVETVTADLSDPQVLGDMVAADYVNSIQEVVALCEPRPPADELKPRIDALFERYVDVFVGYGRYYQEMDAQQRAAVDSKMTNAFFSMGEDVFDRFSQAASHYSALDTELGDRLRAFNIITQYYNYDLLREQEPEEAARLGL